MILRIGNKAIVSVLLVLTLCVVSGGLVHTFSDQSQINHIAQASDDDDGNASDDEKSQKRIKKQIGLMHLSYLTKPIKISQ